MQVFSENDGTVAALKKILDQALEEGQAKSLLVLSCDENGFTPDQLDPILKELPVPVFGGTFPVVTNGTDQLNRGSVVVAMDRRADIYFVPDVSKPETDFEDVLDSMVAEEDDLKTLMVFVDGLSERLSAFIEGLYSVFGLEINYVGGGAGSLSFKQKPCIITNDGLKEDGAVLAAFNLESGVGVSHGWFTISGPYKVTESEHNVIKSLDWKPAFEVYREVVEEHSGMQFTALPFFDIAKAYPFGVAKMGAERVVRDPVALDADQGLVCVGEIPEGVYVDILHGKANNLIQAAGRALDRANKNYPLRTLPALGLIMDCISRVLFLEDGFTSELTAMAMPEIKFVGACSIGEIANSGKDYLEFYNKTAVVAFLEGE